MGEEHAKSPTEEIAILLRHLSRRTHRVEKRLNRLEASLVRPAPLVAFVHIPKTAGATLKGMFATAWSKASIKDAGNYQSNEKKTVGKVTRRPGGWENWRRRGGRATIGHVPYRVFAAHLPDDCLYITFLRDPVDRVLSHYHRHVEKVDPNLGAASSVEEAMAERRMPALNNLATRFLCDDPDADELGDEALEQARANLRRFTFIGLQERFDESVALLQLTLGLDPIPFGARRHVNANRPAVEEVSPEQRGLIAAHNRLDVDLYEYGRDLFETALAEASSDYPAHLAELRDASEIAYEEHEAAARAAVDWLARELPSGATRPRAALIAAGKEAGIRALLVKRAMRELPGVERVPGKNGANMSRTAATVAGSTP